MFKNVEDIFYEHTDRNEERVAQLLSHYPDFIDPTEFKTTRGNGKTGGKTAAQETRITMSDAILANAGEYCKKFFDKNVHTIWGDFKKDPVYTFERRGRKKLGKRQKAFLRYIKGRFLRYKMPLLERYGEIAKAIGCSRTQVVRMTTNFVKEGYLMRFPWVSDKKNDRYIIVPCEPEVAKMIAKRFEQELLEPTYFYLKNVTPQELENVTPLGYILSYILRTYENPNTYKNNTSYCLCSSVPEAPANQDNSFSKQTQEKEMLKANLKTKTVNTLNSNSLGSKKLGSKKSIKVKKTLDRDFASTLISSYLHGNCLTANKKQLLLNNMSEHFEFPVDRLFFNMDNENKNKDFGKLERKLFEMSLKLYNSDVKINYTATNMILNRFNEFAADLKHIKRIHVNHDSLSYIKTSLAVTYHLYFSLDNDLPLFRKIIDRFGEFHLRDNYLRYVKTINLLTFLVDYKDKKYLDKFFNPSDDAFKCEIFKRKAEYEKFQEQWKELYASKFSNPEKGKQLFDRYQWKLSHLLDSTINNAIDRKRDLCGYRLLRHTKCPETGEIQDPIMEMFLDWCITMYGQFRGMNTKMLCDPFVWDEFVSGFMHGEQGLYNFWKPVFKNKEED